MDLPSQPWTREIDVQVFSAMALLDAEERKAMAWDIAASNAALATAVHFFAPGRRFDDWQGVIHETLYKCALLFDYHRGLRFSTYACKALRRELFTQLHREQRPERWQDKAYDPQLDRRATETEPSVMNEAYSPKQLRAAVARLPRKQRIIIERRYGLGCLAATYEAIGKSLLRSKWGVCLIERQALEMLRTELNVDGQV